MTSDIADHLSRPLLKPWRHTLKCTNYCLDGGWDGRSGKLFWLSCFWSSARSGMFGKTSEGLAVMAVRHRLTGGRGEYFRVVGIHSDG